VLVALAWIRRGASELAGADCDHVVALGASAGGFLAQMVAVRADSRDVAGVVSVSAPSTTRHERADGGFCGEDEEGDAGIFGGKATDYVPTRNTCYMAGLLFRLSGEGTGTGFSVFAMRA